MSRHSTSGPYPDTTADRVVRVHRDRLEPLRAQRGVQPRPPEQRHPGPVPEPLAQQPGRGLAGRDHVLGAGVHAELTQVGRDVLGGARGVVGDERDPEALRAGPGQVLRSPGNRPATDVDHTVEVEHGEVVGLHQRAFRGPQTCDRPARKGSPYDAPMDASPVVGPPSVGRPLRLLPFRGWRLTPGRIGDPATGRLFARPYRDVADRLDRWRAAGQLVHEAEPAVYVHEYTSGGLTVRGLVGALDIAHRAASSQDRAVVPHEGIHPDQVSDLAGRMTSWEVNPAPILLVHRGPQRVRDLTDRISAAPPRHEYLDRADQHHRIWAITAADELEELNAALAGSQALIADGHHRYAAYLRMQQEHPGGAADRGLAMLVDQADTPLFLGAIHRVLVGVSLDQFRAACPPSAVFTQVGRADAFAALSQDTLVATDGRSWAAVRLELPPATAAVETLHHELLPALGLTERRIGYHHSVDEALARIRSVRGVAVLMPAPEFDLVVRVALAGRLLPEKATSFQPKPSVGVLIRSLRDE